MEKLRTTATVDKDGVIQAYFSMEDVYGMSARFKYAHFMKPDTEVIITVEYTHRKDSKK